MSRRFAALEARAHRVIAAAGALALSLLAGCARESIPSGGEQGPRTVRLFFNREVSAGPVMLAEAEGYFREEGLTIEWISAGSGRDLLVPLIKGDIDVVTTSLGPAVLNAVANGARLRVVADRGHLAPGPCTYVALVARPDLIANGRLLLPAERDFWRMSYPRGSIFEQLVERALAAEGISATQVEGHYLPATAEHQVLAQGNIDVASATGTSLRAMLDAGTAVVWKRAEDLMPDAQAFVVLFGPSFLDQDPAAGTRFMTAYLRGIRHYNLGRIDGTVRLLAEQIGTTTEEIERSCWIAMRNDGTIHEGSAMAIVEWLREKELLDRPLALTELWEPRFVDAAALRLPATPTESRTRRESE